MERELQLEKDNLKEQLQIFINNIDTNKDKNVKEQLSIIKARREEVQNEKSFFSSLKNKSNKADKVIAQNYSYILSDIDYSKLDPKLHDITNQAVNWWIKQIIHPIYDKSNMENIFDIDIENIIKRLKIEEINIKAFYDYLFKIIYHELSLTGNCELLTKHSSCGHLSVALYMSGINSKLSDMTYMVVKPDYINVHQGYKDGKEITMLAKDNSVNKHI